MSNPDDVTKRQEEFSIIVHSRFNELTKSRGMNANEAAALAMKIAAGMAEMPPPAREVMQALEDAKRDSQPELASEVVHRFFGSADAIHAAFWPPAAPLGDDGEPTVADSAALASCCHVVRVSGSDGAALPLDLTAVSALYDAVLAAGSDVITSALVKATEQMVSSLQMSPAALVNPPVLLRQLAVLLANPLLQEPDHQALTCLLLHALAGLPAQLQTWATDMFATYTADDMRRLVVMLQQFITLTLYNAQTITEGVEDATRCLALLYDANYRSTSGNAADGGASATSTSGTGGATGGGRAGSGNEAGKLHFSEFYNDAVNNDDFNVKEDFRRWKSPYKYDFSFCQYPYIYDPASKARVLQYENQMEQYQELHSALFRGLFNGGVGMDMSPFLFLKVRRGPYLIQDTLIQIHRAKEHDALKKPLKVKFVGEEGVDEGGVQKEFFQLLVRELFNPDYGMFTYDEATRLHWFRPSRIEMDTEFELVGILVGLAIYNSHILEFSFPSVLFKKVTGQRPSIADLAELHPEISSSLQKLLDYPGDVADMSLFFQVEVEVGFGEMEAVDLVENGGTVPVTNDNRGEYVRLYVRHLLETVIEAQFDKFLAGFLRLCSGSALSWFRPQELELLVCGSSQMDLNALEAATLYDDGYTRQSETVAWFWEVVHAFSEAQKKRLLFFVTGSDRVPIKGLASLNPPFVITRNGPASDRLPTAHTCFNHLLLPAYATKDILRERLELAIENAEGFGLI